MRFDVMYRDEASGRVRRAAGWNLAADGRIELMDVAAPMAHALGEIVAYLNALPQIGLEVPPPDDAPRFSLAARQVSCNEPDFVEALAAYVKRYFGFELAAAE